MPSRYAPIFSSCNTLVRFITNVCTKKFDSINVSTGFGVLFLGTVSLAITLHPLTYDDQGVVLTWDRDRNDPRSMDLIVDCPGPATPFQETFHNVEVAGGRLVAKSRFQRESATVVHGEG